MSNEDLVRAVSRTEAIERSGLSLRTWERLEAIGDVPPKLRLSEGRIGYLLSDLKDWLERRREPAPGFKQIGDVAQRVVSHSADIRDHQLKMQAELNRMKGDSNE